MDGPLVNMEGERYWEIVCWNKGNGLGCAHRFQLVGALFEREKHKVGQRGFDHSMLSLRL